MWHLLEVFLHEVFVEKQIVVGHWYPYECSYAQLFCHGIRHDCLTCSGGNVEIASSVGGMMTSMCTLNAKLYVKILVSLVNIVGMVLVLCGEPSVALPVQLSRVLGLSYVNSAMSSDVIAQLQDLQSEGDALAVL